MGYYVAKQKCSIIARILFDIFFKLKFIFMCLRVPIGQQLMSAKLSNIGGLVHVCNGFDSCNAKY